MSDGLSSGGRANIEAQKKLFEKMYRESKVKQSLTTQQQRLNTAYKKPSAPQSNYTKPRGSNAVKAKSKARVVRQKYKGDFKRFGKQVKGAAQRGKVSSAQNISKFGGGVRAKYGSTITKVAPVATKLGVKTKTLGSALASSKFLAGANSVPGIALLVGNYVVWKQNIKTLASIYNVDLPNPYRYLPGYVASETTSEVTGLNGGQEEGVSYTVTTYINIYRPDGSGYFGDVRSPFFEIYGPVKSITVVVREQSPGSSFTGVYTDIEAFDEYGNEKTYVRFEAGNNRRGDLSRYEITRTDGLPDTTYDENYGLPQQIIQQIIDAVRAEDAKGKITTPEPPKTQPSLKLKVDKPKVDNPRVLPIPPILPIPVILPGDNTTLNPRTPFDSPRVIVDAPPDKTKQKKPRSVAKRTFYPESLPFDRPGSEVIKNNQSGVDTVIRRKYASDPNIPKQAIETAVKIPFIFPPGKATPTYTEKNPKGSPLPKATPINPCKRGCNGAGSGTSFTPGSTNATTIAGLINDLLLQNPLLAKIDRTTTKTRDTVLDPGFGLQKIQQFADTAWKATRADKIINGLALFTSLHNAAQLSTNVVQSLGDTASAGLGLFNIKNFDGQPIDVNSAIGTRIESLLTSIFGASNLNAASETWKKLNRIFQSTAAVVNSVQGTKNALLEADEITGGNLAKLANTFLLEGQVQEDAYELMNEQPDYQTHFAGILGKINAIDEISDRASSIISSGSEIKENLSELVTNSDELKQATDEFRTAKKTEEEEKDIASESPAIDRLDLLKKEPGE